MTAMSKRRNHRFGMHLGRKRKGKTAGDEDEVVAA